MKKKLLSLSVLSAIIVFSACKKQDTTTPATILTINKSTGIMLGEPVSFKVTSITSDTAVIWSISPASNSKISGSGLNASIFFRQKGQYSVTAKVGGTIATTTVNVTDSIYAVTLPLNGDQIKLTPSVISTGALKITAQTINSYSCLNNYLQDSTIIGRNNNTTLNFYGVAKPTGYNCTSGQIRATSFQSFAIGTNGTYTLAVVLNGITYTGSYVKKDNSYTFTWSYNNGVTIYPLSVTK